MLPFARTKPSMRTAARCFSSGVSRSRSALSV
jgi:hypothetical protein